MKSALRRWRNYRPATLILVGLCLSGAAWGVDLVSAGGRSGFGTKQAALLVVGLYLILRGFLERLAPGKAPSARRAASFNSKWIAVLGAVNLASFAVYTILSYGMAPLLPFGAVQPHNAEFFARLVKALGFLGPEVGAFVSGHSALANQQVILVAYCLPVIVSTIASVGILVMLGRCHDCLQPHVPQLLFRWAAAFAAISALASPVLVHDFWYPLAWGRMVAAGVNPYYVDLTAQFTTALPLNGSHERMMYGPLLATGAGAIMGLVNGDGFLGAALFKLLLSAAWIGSLRLIWGLLRGQSVWHQSVGVAFFGWLPLGLIQGVADGHNDVFMVFFVLLWLYGLDRGKPLLASVSLAASVLVKYATAPLFVLDVIYLIRSRRQRLWEYWPQFAAVALFSAVVFAPYFRSLDFFGPVLPRTAWHFFSPREAVLTVENWLGVSSHGYGGAVARLVFPVLALYSLVRYLQRPGADSFRVAVLSMMSTALFGFITGLWPWYLIWVLACAAVVPGSVMSRWVLGVALVGPFVILAWVILPNLDGFYKFELPALALYSLSLGWLALVPARWFQHAPTVEDELLGLQRANPSDDNVASGEDLAAGDARLQEAESWAAGAASGGQSSLT